MYTTVVLSAMGKKRSFTHAGDRRELDNLFFIVFRSHRELKWFCRTSSTSIPAETIKVVFSDGRFSFLKHPLAAAKQPCCMLDILFVVDNGLAIRSPFLSH